MKYAILAATGQIGRMTADYLLKNTDADLVLFGHHASQRLASYAGDRVTFVDGDLKNQSEVEEAVAGTDGVFVAFVVTPEIAKTLSAALKEVKVNRLVVMSIPDLYQEVSGPFQKWYRTNTGLVWQTPLVEAADIIEKSDLDYVILRTTWLYNNPANTKVEVTQKGEPYTSAQITREAVAKFASQLLTGEADYHQANLGIGEPDTAWTKPSFY
ncbi:NAD(P)H-binding protein [Lactobacillus corticis]|uniref:NAD-dependent dehydratase n=1 Tax=Lactobacillus corticis TaxID=2201249 RepID=A0A916QFA0_9LACO|nr:NAD(P)H-binding protein [Lactobacillus corticis]GFZ26224.1 NAD-dependent dehydratase [Lactobacillus corticis]